ncbi:MAG TPA: diguanylate cyclase [Clostridia bacterium]|nr:diguanylate cyclase [Clostridia bacterium]HOR89328.1 diguanylate cyclase [Clostridia bacterium]
MKKVNEITFFILIAAIFISTFVLTDVLDMPNLYLIDREGVSFIDGWTWKGDGYKERYYLPHRFDVEKSEPLVIKNTVPDHFPAGSVIALKANVQSVVIKIDGETVYDIGNDRSKFMGRDLGNYWAVVKTQSEHKGKEIEISLFSHRAASHGFASEVFIGSESAFYGYLFAQHGLWNIFPPIIFILGIMIILTFFFLGMYKEKNLSLLYLGIYALLMSNWFLGDSEMLQLFTANTYYATRIAYLMTLVSPIPVSLYIREAVPMKKRFFDDFLIGLIIINTIVSLGLEHSGILGLSDTVLVAVGLISVMCVYYMAIFIIESVAYKNEKALRELKSLSVIFIFAVAEIISYFVNGQIVSSLYLRIGVLIYIVLVLIYQVKDYRERRRIRVEKEYYEKMAYTDAMTGAGNRARFMEDMDMITKPEKVIIVLADIDRMKYINDYFGHFSGDKAIIDTYNTLNTNFGHIGRIYRIGGDEFVVIVEKININEIYAIIKNLEKEVDLIDKESEYDFSISLGVAEYDASLDEDIHATFLRVDHSMYENKKKHRTAIPAKMPDNQRMYQDKTHNDH